MEVNHPCSAAFANACAGKAHACFSKATGSAHEVALLRVSRQIFLKRRVVTVWKALDCLGEIGFFNEFHITLKYIALQYGLRCLKPN